MKGKISTLVDEKYKNMILKKGWFVIEQAVSREETDKILKQFWKDIYTLGTGVTEDPKTHTNSRWPQTENGLMQSHGCGHFESAWMCRIATFPTWKKIYKNDDELLTSVDGFSFCRPQTQNNMYKKSCFPTWMHIDQKLSSNFLDNIQGMLALSKTEDQDLSTVFWEPHTMTAIELYTKFQENFRNECTGQDWFPFNQNHYNFYEEHCVLKKPNLNPGDLLIWASSTPHASHPGEIKDQPRKLRISNFISMLPKKIVAQRSILRNKQLMEYKLTTSHNIRNLQLFTDLRFNTYIQYKSYNVPSYREYIDESFEQRRKMIGY